MIHLYFFLMSTILQKEKKNTRTQAYLHIFLHFLRKQVQKTNLFAHYKKEQSSNQQVEINLYYLPFINHST